MATQATPLETLETFLGLNPSVRYLRYLLVDYGGIIRVHSVSKSVALSHAKNGKGLGMHSPMVAGGATNEHTVMMEIVVAPRDVAHPDWSSLRVCGHDPVYAHVMCFVEEESLPVERRFSRCPRTHLRDALAKSQKDHGLDFLVGFELEFYITEVENGVPTRPVDNHSMAFAMEGLYGRYNKVVEEIITKIEDSGITINKFHPEGTKGQFEISLAPLPPMEAADAWIHCKDTIRAVCAKKDLWATLYPRPFEDSDTTGQHIHFSLSSRDKGPEFLAGVLEATPALTAFAMPAYESYTRSFKWVGWGVQTRTATYRQIEEGYWELRQPDACMNPYLTLAAVIHAGSAGVEKQLPLLIKPQLELNIGGLSDEQRKELNVTTPCPKSLTEALDALEGSELFKEAFGPELFDRYLLVKRKEEKSWAGKTFAQKKAIGMRSY